MAQTSRETVIRCLTFQSPERIPRDIWLLPWTSKHYPQEVAEIQRRFPSDFGMSPNVYLPSPRQRGDPFVEGTYVDEWGCVFTNIQAGLSGEVLTPMLTDLKEWRNIRPPYEILPHNWIEARDKVNRYCESTDLFVLAGTSLHPWERYQFLRGSQDAYIDIGLQDNNLYKLLQVIHDFYLKELEFWVSTDVDAIRFRDDWGSDRHLLISPHTWRKLFKPLYKEYCDLAHAHDKFVFMHSDGHILDIYPDLIEIGVDAINSQLFCMDFEQVAKSAKGKITFWGEIDRQYVLSAKDPELGRAAVHKVVQHLYDPRGGVIAQLEFGPGANPDTVVAVYDEWNKVSNSMSNDVYSFCNVVPSAPLRACRRNDMHSV